MHRSTRFAATALLVAVLNAPAHAAILTRDPEPPLTRIVKFIKHLFHPSTNDDTWGVPKP